MTLNEPIGKTAHYLKMALQLNRKPHLMFTVLLASLCSALALSDQSIDHNNNSTMARKFRSRNFFDPCVSNFTCGSYTICIKNVCRCLSGFVASSGGEGCVHYSCTNKYECEDRFTDSECSQDGTCECIYYLDWDSQLCAGWIGDWIKIAGIIVVILVLIIIIAFFVRYLKLRKKQNQATSPKFAAQSIKIHQPLEDSDDHYLDLNNQVEYPHSLSPGDHEQNKFNHYRSPAAPRYMLNLPNGNS